MHVMKRLVVVLFVGALLAGAGVVFWPSSDQTASDEPAAVPTKQPPVVVRRPVEVPAVPKLLPASLAGGVHRHGIGVKGVTISARGNGTTSSVLSTDGGAFAFDALPPGEYLLSAIIGDEASQVLGPLYLESSEKKTGVVLELLPA